MKYDNAVSHTPRELLAELQALGVEAKALMSDSLSENSAEALANLRARFDAAHEQFAEIYEGTKKKVIAGARYTDVTVRENPYQAVAIALGVGALIGVILGRRSR
jgi:ElaB/YqjD/DUF883 family membrane-anchored ribosome-binding protein